MHSKDREFQNLAVGGKKLLTQTSLQHLGMMTMKNYAIYQNNDFDKNKEVEPVEPVQMNIYQSNNYRKD